MLSSKADDSAVVHIAGDEIIIGSKTFSSNVINERAAPQFTCRDTRIVKGVESDFDVWNRIITYQDKNGLPMACVEHYFSNNFRNRISLIAIKSDVTTPVADQSEYAFLTVGFDENGNQFSYAPKPAADDNSYNIAVTSWIRDVCVLLSGDQTIGGLKTFVSGRLVGETQLYLAAAGTTQQTGLFGGPHAQGGASVEAFGLARSINPGSVKLRPFSSASTYKELFAKPDGTLTWNGQAMQIISDAKAKTLIYDFPDEVLDVWEDVRFVQFKFIEAISLKGDGARSHAGVVAQRLLSAFSARGVDALAYGFVCYDGASDAWHVRYEEILCVEAAYQRRENARLRARMASLEERLAALELKIS